MDQLQVYQDNSNTNRFMAVNLLAVARRVLTRDVCYVMPVLVICTIPCLAKAKSQAGLNMVGGAFAIYNEYIKVLLRAILRE